MSELGSKVKQSPSLKARALRLLSLKEYSRKELGSKLNQSEKRRVQRDVSRKTAESESDNSTPRATDVEIEAVLNDFEERGWLSDIRFAEALVRRRSERFGVRRIQDELGRAGIDSEKSASLLSALRETEYQRAHELWLRKFGAVASDPKERARQYRFLASKGFSADVVVKVVSGR
jgi:regulatory protein|uniref:regulatory protein RecX n=1 Tax=Polynucleobacter sp. TaxID=2029855 RepID=UPI0040486413